MLAGAVLVHSGERGAEALEAIARARRVSVPDTEEQRQWFLKFADSFRAGQTARVVKPARPLARKRAAGD
jgi:hypothetical protein